MKKPITIGITDLHMVSDNISELHDIVKQMCITMDELGLTTAFMSGDLFDSRVSQRQDVLTGMHDLFNIFYEAGKDVLVIPGNHDKTNYKSKSSFLDLFAWHPAVTLFPEYGLVEISKGVILHFLPFFEYGCDLFNESLEEAKFNIQDDMKNVMVGHMAVEGSVNNDGSKVSGGLNRGELAAFDLVLLGHYHDTHNVGKNILHISAARQKNFGEDENKGFTVLYDDLSAEVINPSFTLFKTYHFDLNTVDIADVIAVANEIHGNGNRNRFEFVGDRERVKGFDGSRFQDMGIDIKKKYVDLEQPIKNKVIDKKIELNIWDASKITDRFSLFCGTNQLDLETGSIILTKIINRSNGKE